MAIVININKSEIFARRRDFAIDSVARERRILGQLNKAYCTIFRTINMARVPKSVCMNEMERVRVL